MLQVKVGYFCLLLAFVSLCCIYLSTKLEREHVKNSMGFLQEVVALVRANENRTPSLEYRNAPGGV
jgi:hypothetical protein